MRVLANKGRDLCRDRRRMRRAADSANDDDESPVDQGPSVEPNLEPLAAAELERLLQAIAGELPRLHRPQDVDGLLRSLRCHLEARLGASIEDQLEAYGFAPDEPSDRRGPESFARARNRVYQYRARGRAAGCEALASLLAQGLFGADDVSDVHRLLGCDVHTQARKEKKDLS
jgi:hypothetical protein